MFSGSINDPLSVVARQNRTAPRPLILVENMNADTWLTCGAIAIEATILGTLAALCVRSITYRKYAVVALGSLAPLVFFYISTIVAFVRDPTDPSVRFAYYGMWIMGLAFFFGCLGVGLAVARSSRPTNLGLRFLLGASVTSGLFGLMALHR